MFPLLTVEQDHYKHCSVTELKRVLWLVPKPAIMLRQFHSPTLNRFSMIHWLCRVLKWQCKSSAQCRLELMQKKLYRTK